MKEKVKALLDAIAEWEKVDGIVARHGWGTEVIDDNGNVVLVDEWWDACRRNLIAIAEEVRNEIV